LLPDSARIEPEAIAAVAGAPSAPTDAQLAAPLPVAAVEAETVTGVELGRGGYGPLGGAGSPRRFARHLPIERDGHTHFLAVEQVVAVHANAHYTYIFDGSDKLFCSLAIGDVESRLDDRHFVRVHRSHIVNIERVVGYRRSGDNELVEMAGVAPCLVPVSRSRIGSLKSRVASLNGEDIAFVRKRRLAAQ
jgi:DNA-binding LytR/AlgR family response regulator